MGEPRLDLDGLTDDQVRELALAYLDLFAKMLDAIRECETGHGFFWLEGPAFKISGHPPHSLIDAILAADQQP